MDLSSLPLAEVLARKLAQARHAGWLAGVAMRLDCASVTRNPYKKGSDLALYWEAGFEQGLAG